MAPRLRNRLGFDILHDVGNANQWAAEFGRNTATMVVLNGKIVPP